MTADGWVIVPLAEIAGLHQGFGFPKSLQGRTTGDLGFYKVSDISRAVIAGNEYLGPANHCISTDEACRLRATPLPKDSVVFARIGEAINLNRRALLPEPALVDNNVIGVKARPGVEDRYLFYFLKTVKLGELSQATTVPAVRTSDIATLKVPLAPSKEQARIVSKIDELFSDIDEGERALEHVQKLVERYRQSVLKAAVTGELTREWREKHKGQLESGEVLLQRILRARREAWEKAELARMRAKGVKPPNDKWKEKYQEPTRADTSELPRLPGGWTWASMDMVTDIVGGITVDQKRGVEECESVAYLRVANVQRGYLDLSEVKMISALKNRIDELQLRHGDILFNEGGDIDKLGRGWIWESQISRCIHQNHVFRARLFVDGCWNKIFSWYGNTLGRTLFLRLGKQTTNLASLSLSKLRAFSVPVMDAKEASEIVSRVEDMLSIADKEFNELKDQTHASIALRQAVLKSAFSGKLVPQDANDEPASVMLSRISSSRRDSESRIGKRRHSGNSK